MPQVVEAENLSFSYGADLAVDNVSFSLEKGDYLVLVGHNGSGKSTLIKLILGLLKTNQGKIALFGQDLSSFSSWAKIGFLPQNIGLFNPLFPITVAEVVTLGLISQKNKTERKKVDTALEHMGITRLQDKLVGELSGGEMQRTLLARAIVNEPELVILDEPVSAVDAQTREEFFAHLNHLNKEKGATVILITHDVAYSGKYANKLLFLDKRLVFFGTLGQFCLSSEMEDQFGAEIQHLICHQH